MAVAVMTTTPLPSSVLPLPLPARPGGEIGLGLGVGVATIVEGAASSHSYNIHHRSHSNCVGSSSSSSSSSSPFTALPRNCQSRGRSSSPSRRTSSISQGRLATDMTEEAIDTEGSSNNTNTIDYIKQVDSMLPSSTNINSMTSTSPSIKGHRKRPSLQVYAGGRQQQQQDASGNTSPRNPIVTSPGTYDRPLASNIAYKTSILPNTSSSSPSSSTPSSAVSSRPGSGGNTTITTNTNTNTNTYNNNNDSTTSHLRRTSSVVRAIDFAYPSINSSRSSSVSNGGGGGRAFVSRTSSSASAVSSISASEESNSYSNSNSSSRRESASSSASRFSYASSSSPSSSVASQFRNCSLSMQPHFFDGAVFLDSDEEDDEDEEEDDHHHRQSRNFKHHLQQPNRNHFSNQQTTKSPRLQMPPAFSPTSSTASTLFSPMSSDFPPTPPTRSASESSATDSHAHAGTGAGSSGNIETVHPVKQRFPIASSDDESGLEAEVSQHHAFGYYDGEEVMKNQVDRIRESQLHSRRGSHCSAGSVDSDTITCFQPGCDMTISPGTYYCERHDDPFQDDP